MTRQWHSEHGLAPLELMGFTALVLLPLVVMAFGVTVWWERQSLARATAQEAARAVAVAGSWQNGAAAARGLVDDMATNHGLDPDEVTVTLEGALQPGATVHATTQVAVPPTSIPFITELPSFTISASHREHVANYRSFD